MQVEPRDGLHLNVTAPGTGAPAKGEKVFKKIKRSIHGACPQVPSGSDSTESSTALSTDRHRHRFPVSRVLVVPCLLLGLGSLPGCEGADQVWDAFTSGDPGRIATAVVVLVASIGGTWLGVSAGFAATKDYSQPGAAGLVGCFMMFAVMTFATLLIGLVGMGVAHLLGFGVPWPPFRG